MRKSLRSYIESPLFKDVNLLEQDLMNRQYGYMVAYSLTLRQRIEIHEGKENETIAIH